MAKRRRRAGQDEAQEGQDEAQAGQEQAHEGQEDAPRGPGGASCCLLQGPLDDACNAMPKTAREGELRQLRGAPLSERMHALWPFRCSFCTPRPAPFFGAAWRNARLPGNH